MSDLFADIRHALRHLAARPVFTAAAVLTLALAIGATSAVVSLADRVLLRDLPIAEPDRVVQVVIDRGDAGTSYNLSYPLYQDLRDGARGFDGIVAQSPLRVALAERGTELVDADVVTEDYFDVLGVPVVGRGFRPDEAVLSGGRAVVLSHALWRNRFDGRRGVLGGTVTLNGLPFTIVGIADPSFDGVVRGAATALWVPFTAYPALASGDDLTARGRSWLTVLARLAPGATQPQVEDRLAVLGRRLQADGRLADGTLPRLVDARGGLRMVVGAVEAPLRVLALAVACILLIACANVASLFLARAASRRREIAVRRALGAGRARLIRQLLTESMVLWVIGGAAGVLLAGWLMDLLLGFRPPTGVRFAVDAGLDGRVLALAGLVTAVTGIAFGLIPALHASRSRAVTALRSGATAPGGRRIGARELFVVGQVGLSLGLVVAAGLLLRSFANLRNVDPGFTPSGVLLAEIDLEPLGYGQRQSIAFYHDLLERLRRLPAVEAASAASTISPHPWGSRWDGFALEGHVPTPDRPVGFDVNRVAPSYFETLRMPVLHGRAFDDRDVAGAPRVAMINETMAARYWPGETPVGRHIYAGDDSTAPAIEIIGIVADAKYRSLREEPLANVYFPVAQQFFRPALTVVARAGANAAALAPAVRTAVRSLDPDVPVNNVRTLSDHLATAYDQDRMLAVLVAAFGGIALVLAGVGLFGVVALYVSQRTREIGVRVALGARTEDVARLVLGRAAWLVAGGLALGLGLAALLSRVAASVLYDVPATDPASWVAGALVLAAAALLASWLPTRRATRLDPMEALRHE